MFETDRFRDFMLLRLDEEKFFLSDGLDTDGDPDRGKSSCPSEIGIEARPTSSREAPGTGDGTAGRADSGPVVRLGPAESACRCWTI